MAWPRLASDLAQLAPSHHIIRDGKPGEVELFWDWGILHDIFFLVVLRCFALRFTACLLLSLGARPGGPSEVQAKVAREPKTWPARPPLQRLPLN
jgi:hypothetical protein